MIRNDGYRGSRQAHVSVLVALRHAMEYTFKWNVHASSGGCDRKVGFASLGWGLSCGLFRDFLIFGSMSKLCSHRGWVV